LHTPRKHVSERIGGNHQELQCDNVSEATTEMLEEEEDGGQEEEDLAEGAKEGS